jgi:multidrug efflux pump subunit AcrB
MRVVFLTGIVQFLFTPLALSVVFSLLASYFLSFTLVPTLSRYLLAGEKHEDSGHSGRRSLPDRLNALREGTLDGLRDWYGSLLALLLRHRWFVLLLMALVGVITAILGRFVGTDFFPPVDVGIMKLHYRAPVGLRIEETE